MDISVRDTPVPARLRAAAMKLEIADRLSELPYRLLATSREGRTAAPLDAHQTKRLSIVWPAVYQWSRSDTFVGTLRSALRHKGVLQVRTTPQLHKGIVQLYCTIDGRPHVIALDYFDRPDVINAEALEECSLYFKFQYRAAGYADERIRPGGYPVSDPHYYRYHRVFRNRFARRRTIDVLGRFGFQFGGDMRRNAVAQLSGAGDINYVGAGARVRYSRFLREASSSKLCLDLPGNGPFTFRLPEFLGVGTCLVAPEYSASLHEPLVPGTHYVTIAPDLSDLLDVCRYYLAHDEERERIAGAGREYFDNELHCDRLASYYVCTILRALGTQ